MTDARGVELKCGDEVMYIEPYYRELELGTVMWVTPHGARIMACKNDEECNRESCRIVKIESEEDYD